MILAGHRECVKKKLFQSTQEVILKMSNYFESGAQCSEELIRVTAVTNHSPLPIVKLGGRKQLATNGGCQPDLRPVRLRNNILLDMTSHYV